MLKVNVVCSSCRRRYSVEVPDGAGVYTVSCPYCSSPYDVTVAHRVRQSAPVSGPDAVARKVRRCEVASNIAWLVIGVVQCVLLYTAAAGVWNIVNAFLCLRNVKNIVAHNPQVIPYFDQRRIWLIVMAVVNVVLGGVVGVLLVLFELYVRGFVLRNREAFEV